MPLLNVLILVLLMACAIGAIYYAASRVQLPHPWNILLYLFLLVLVLALVFGVMGGHVAVPVLLR